MFGLLSFYRCFLIFYAPVGPQNMWISGNVTFMAPNWASNVLPFAGLVHSRSHADKKVDP